MRRRDGDLAGLTRRWLSFDAKRPPLARRGLGLLVTVALLLLGSAVLMAVAK